MEQTCQNDDFGLKGEKFLEKKTDKTETPNKCNQCDYASSRAGQFRRHLITHGGEKSYKCNQCYFASSYASALRTHLKTHSGEKPNKCNQCDFASSQARLLSQHLKTHSGEKPNKCTQCDFACSHESSPKFSEETYEEAQTSRNVTIFLCGQTLLGLA